MKQAAPKIKFYSHKTLDQIPYLEKVPPAIRDEMRIVSQVLPFRVNNYVIEQLIDWDNVPEDPMFQLTFPQRGMLSERHFDLMASAVARGIDSSELRKIADSIRLELNPHPEGQLEHNVPELDGDTVPGVQHKYRETALVFPSAGQTCHAYCSFCFRWAQFVGIPDLKLATDESARFADYLKKHREVTDVLFTGGDPMVMRTRLLEKYVGALEGEDFDHLRTIRFGTKSISYWPYRYVSDADADDLLRLFERIVASGRHVAIMAHFNHWREQESSTAREAIRRIRSTGAEIRTQSPLIRHINDDPDVWAKMWKQQVGLGCHPYYMFVERDTGAKHHFEIPLERAFEIYQGAIQQVSGLGRTARGPVMSAFPGKVQIHGKSRVGNDTVFVLSLLQARNPSLTHRPFFAEFDPTATWLHDLRPAFGADRFFFEQPVDRGLGQHNPLAN